MHKRGTPTRAVQCRVQDVTVHDVAGHMIPHTDGLAQLITMMHSSRLECGPLRRRKMSRLFEKTIGDLMTHDHSTTARRKGVDCLRRQLVISGLAIPVPVLVGRDDGRIRSPAT